MSWISIEFFLIKLIHNGAYFTRIFLCLLWTIWKMRYFDKGWPECHWRNISLNKIESLNSSNRIRLFLYYPFLHNGHGLLYCNITPFALNKTFNNVIFYQVVCTSVNFVIICNVRKANVCNSNKKMKCHLHYLESIITYICGIQMHKKFTRFTAYIIYNLVCLLINIDGNDFSICY